MIAQGVELNPHRGMVFLWLDPLDGGGAFQFGPLPIIQDQRHSHLVLDTEDLMILRHKAHAVHGEIQDRGEAPQGSPPTKAGKTGRQLHGLANASTESDETHLELGTARTRALKWVRMV